MIKSLQEGGGGGDDFEIKSISSTRIKNLAKAYAWWIAKDSITFAVLKVWGVSSFMFMIILNWKFFFV